MKIGHFICCLLFPLGCHCQIAEDFSDGDFTNGNQWTGDQESFIVHNGQLQLHEIENGESFLGINHNISIEASWTFDIKMAFNPSARNFCRVYAISDVPDLTKELKGYYVQIGGSQDEISLYRQDITEHIKIIDGPDGIVDTSQVNLTIKISRDKTNNWSLFLKNPNQDRFELIGSVEDSMHTDVNFFGFYCKYTISRSRGFLFDNVLIEGEQFIDHNPPIFTSIKVLDKHNLRVEMNEPIQTPDISQFFVNTLGQPIEISNPSYNTFILTFQESFKSGVKYTLDGLTLTDYHDNNSTLSHDFIYWKVQPAQKHDVIISEIMADPTPALQLPEKEYLEIHNKSNKWINLHDWKLLDMTRETLLPDYLLSPDSFVVLSAKSSPGSFTSRVPTIELDSWPTLNNSGDLIMLIDSSGNLVHFVDYRDSWYRSNIKSQGGWSLEMIDTNFPCTGAQNWIAALGPLGGTPGHVNSVATDNPDLSPPKIVRTFAISKTQLELTLDQALSQEPNGQAEIFIYPALRIDTFFVNAFEKPVLTIQLTDSLMEDIIYQIAISGFMDCNLNFDINPGEKVPVALAQTPDSLDLVINEILFNPRPLGVRFVELYNRSSKALNLRNWSFARWQSGTLTDFTSLRNTNLMIYPGQHLVFTEDDYKLRNQYPNCTNVIMNKVKDLPTMGDKNGSIVVMSPSGAIIDELLYDENMHHPLLIDQNGVSLERGSPDQRSDDPNNWYSASESAGYATPGKPNSQKSPAGIRHGLSVFPNIIAGNSNRFPAYASILFRVSQPGTAGSVSIFNAQGHKVKSIANNTLLPVSGSFQWDGTNNRGMLVPFGYYIVQFQLLEPNGQKRQLTQTLVVAPDF